MGSPITKSTTVRPTTANGSNSSGKASSSADAKRQQQSYTCYHLHHDPATGWAESDSKQWARALVNAVDELVVKQNVSSFHCVAVSFS